MYKVLIVDDDPAVRDGLPLLIDWHASGFEVSAVVENGRKALEMLRISSFDLVITDIRMPGLDGIALAQENRQLPSPCKMVILSGYGEFGFAQEAMQYGVRRYLLKPVSEDLLLQTLAELREELRRERNPQAAPPEPEQAESVQLGRTLEPIISFIHDNCMKKLSLQEIASMFYLNSAYLGRIFKRYTGESFNQYLINCRIKLAKRLLHQGMSVTEVASMVSYEDTDHFAHLFKRHVGLSPSEYRSGRRKSIKNN